jgi:hypothetical protein
VFPSPWSVGPLALSQALEAFVDESWMSSATFASLSLLLPQLPALFTVFMLCMYMSVRVGCVHMFPGGRLGVCAVRSLPVPSPCTCGIMLVPKHGQKPSDTVVSSCADPCLTQSESQVPVARVIGARLHLELSMVKPRHMWLPRSSLCSPNMNSLSNGVISPHPWRENSFNTPRLGEVHLILEI